jgi:hypothetical protein
MTRVGSQRHRKENVDHIVPNGRVTSESEQKISEMEISWFNICEDYNKHILWKYDLCWHSVVENNLEQMPVLNMCESGIKNSNAINL